MITPGTQVECAIGLDEDKELIDVRSALIYNVIESKIIMSQTSPELSPSSVGNTINVTYFNKRENKRLGMNCKVEEIIKDYKLASSQPVPAVILTGLSDVKEFNLRLAYRIRPPDDYDIKLYGPNNKLLEIVDISATGARFRHFSKHQFKVDQTLMLRLRLNSISYDIKARVVREEQYTGFGQKEFIYVAVHFEVSDKDMQDTLVRAIREMERLIRFKDLNKASL